MHKKSRIEPWNGNNGYQPGNNWVICDICGFKMRANQTRYNYNGLLVCFPDWEPEHPQERIKAVKEKIVPDKVRVEGDTSYTYETPSKFDFQFDFNLVDNTWTKVTPDDL